MSGLAFEVEWETALRGNISPEMQATWAQLEILVDGASVTHCIVGSASKRRILVPLYSLAEWFAFNWWRLLFEPYSLGRGISDKEYFECHALLNARDGFALPDLRFYPEGDLIRICWFSHRMTHQPMEFVSNGELLLPRDQVSEAISSFVEQVLERLATQQVGADTLTDEWTAIHTMAADEVRFCQSAARLALDPFNLTDDHAARMENVLMGFPDRVQAELASVATVDNLPQAGSWIEEGMKRSDLPKRVNLDWLAAKRQLVAGRQNQLPWRSGYELANQFRDFLKLDDHYPIQLPDFDLLTLAAPVSIPTIDGLVLPKDEEFPVCLTAKRRHDSRRFQFARSICEYLSTSDDSPSLMTTGPTDAQKRSRAFAAELLAPQRALRARLKTNLISEDELDDLASEFQVSSRTIEHQLQNHQLATVQ